MSPSDAILLILGGICAGFVNTLAGGGSFLTLPLLMLVGLDASVANGTNRVAVLIQSLVATWQFRRHGKLPEWRTVAALLLPAVAGGLLGAKVAVDVPEPLLRGLIGGVLLLAIPTVLRPAGGAGGKAKTRAQGAADATTGNRAGQRATRPGILLLLFLCGFYGGFLQAGVGILLLAVLVPLVGFDLVRANAVKVLLITVYTALAIPVFVAGGQVQLLAGLVLALGNVIGALLGTRLAIRGGARVIRWVLVVALILAATALLDLPARCGIGGAG